jgi:hypothetical protein
MKQLALTLLVGLLAAPALALSCLPPDAVFIYQQIKKDPADYLLIKGTVMLGEPANLPLRTDTKTTDAQTKARVTGHALTRTGFQVAFDAPITIRATCTGPWCGTPEGLADGAYILALKLEDVQPVLTRGPCGGLIVPWSAADEQRLLTCHLGGECQSQIFLK